MPGVRRCRVQGHRHGRDRSGRRSGCANRVSDASAAAGVVATFEIRLVSGIVSIPVVDR
jgi:hypothetical protein